MNLNNEFKRFHRNPIFAALGIWIAIASIVSPAHAGPEDESTINAGSKDESFINAGSEDESTIDAGSEDESPAGKMVIANRDDGTISVINVQTNEVVDTISLSDPICCDETIPEPMYVVYSEISKRVFVGDRAYHRVVVFSADDFSEEAAVEVGAGVFHMWVGPENSQLWVIGDIDKTATVIDPSTLDVLFTVEMPFDLVGSDQGGGKPHDIVVDKDFAYISILGLNGDDVVVKFERDSFSEIGRRTLGKGTHLALNRKDRLLYVASQNDGKVFALDNDTLSNVAEIDVPGAHGVAVAENENTLYTTDITTADGSDALYAIDTETISIIDTLDTFDTENSVPHNIALTPNNDRLYITHSGAGADKVSVYLLVQGIPDALVTTIDVGLNPFGLAFVP